MSVAGDRSDGQVQLVPASSLTPAALTAVFNLGFSDYLVALHMDEDGLHEHVAVNDIDLDRSIVAVGPEPVGFALTGRRGSAAWIGGLGVAPAHRRTGLGRRLMEAAVHSAARAGADAVWLEVLQANRAAIALYEGLGFERGRELAVQRDDASLGHMRERGMPLRAVAVPGSDGLGGAAIYKSDGITVTIIQLAAEGAPAARDLLLAAAGADTLRLSNIPDDHVFSHVL
ncbi:MAG TPA: GNAT family N-acetyltransferase, partial [Solirubrobacteraceae bacterium]